jgi:1-deoxy-D-xylulose-5-phosphate synthase
VAIFGLGNMFEVAEEAARKLEEKGISVALINPRWIKPMDTGTLEFFARSVEWSARSKITFCITVSAAR